MNKLIIVAMFLCVALSMGCVSTPAEPTVELNETVTLNETVIVCNLSAEIKSVTVDDGNIIVKGRNTGNCALNEVYVSVVVLELHAGQSHYLYNSDIDNFKDSLTIEDTDKIINYMIINDFQSKELNPSMFVNPGVKSFMSIQSSVFEEYMGGLEPGETFTSDDITIDYTYGLYGSGYSWIITNYFKCISYEDETGSRVILDVY